jgi:hypothetical protein
MSEFDFANPDMPNSKRTSTVVPQQALFLMNSPMAVDTVRSIDTRPEFTQAKNDSERLFQLYRIIFQRAPHPEEVRLGLQFVAIEQTKQTKIEANNAAQNVKREQAQQAAKKKTNEKKNGGALDGSRPIINEGETVAVKPLTPWESYTQALLFSNEASYVN